MNEIYVNGNKIELPTSDSISIKDIKGMDLSYKPSVLTFKNVIATCDNGTLYYIRNIFKTLESKIVSSKGAERLAYITMHKKLLEKVASYTLIKKETSYLDGLDIESFSEPEIHQMEEEFDISIEKSEQTGIEEQHFTTLEEDEQSVFETSSDNSVIDVDYREAGKEDTFVEFKKDPSQDSVSFNEVKPQENIKPEEKRSLLERLQQINSEGRIFTDESRITDSTLNINNAISLGKLNLGTINTEPSKQQKVNIQNSKILEMGKTKYETLKNACSSFNKKLESETIKEPETSYKIKSGLICRYNQISRIDIKDCTIAEMPEEFSRDISTGARNIFARSKNNTSTASQKFKKQLLELKERLISESSIGPVEEAETAKVM